MTMLIGLTGGVGSGKSTVAALFERAGITTIDTDAIAQQLTAPGGSALAAIARQFGSDFISDKEGLKRAKMREQVFADAAARTALEAILHPLIQAQVELALPGIRSPYGMIVVPLLFESMSYRRIVKRALVVDCSVATQIARITKRPGLTRTLAEAIVAAQIPRRIRLQLADDLICNENDLAGLDAVVHSLHQLYIAEAQCEFQQRS